MLFERIDQFISEHVNEENLFRAINQDGQFGSRKRLTDLSNYLYDKILESMRANPIEREQYYKLNGLLQDICTLYYMGLQDDCFQIIQQAKKIASRLEKHHYMLETIEWEMRLAARKATESDMENNVKNLENNYLKYHEKSKRTIQAYLQTIILRNKTAKFNVQEGQEHIPGLMHLKSYFSDENHQNRGFRDIQHFYRSKKFFADLMLKIEPEQNQYWSNEAFKSLEKGLAIYENPEFQIFKLEEPSTYGVTLENFLTACLKQEKFEIFDAKCAELEQNTFNVSFLNKSVWYLRINSFIARNQIIEAKEYIETHQVVEKLKKWAKEMQPSRLLILRYQCAFVYFMQGQWEKTREILTDSLSWHRPDDHQIVVILSDLLDMICMYELKIYGKTPMRLFENFEKRQRRSKQWNNFLRDLTHVMRQAMSPDSPALRSNKYELVQQQVLSQKQFTSFGGILAWVDTKLENISLMEAVKRYN